MVKIKDTNIANAGVYYGQDVKGDNKLENLTYDSLKRLVDIYKSIPVTFNHDSKEILGYFDNLKMIHDMMIGDLNLYSEDDIEKCLNTYISPEFVIDDNDKPVAIVYASIVDNPAISDNLKILEDDYTLNAKKKMPYRSQKVQIVQIKDATACKQCKKIADETRGKPVTWEKANSMLPVHPNCRCKIQKA